MTPAPYVVLNLHALEHNLNRVRQFAPKAKVMAVIKANAYGHGLFRAAKTLRDVDAFAVARVHEGVRLRQAGINNRIAVLEGFTCAEELNQLLMHRLELIIHSEQQLEVLEQHKAIGNYVVWLKLDTGMNRLGISSADLANVYERLMRCAGNNISVNLMTHLANADRLDDEATQRQITLFQNTISNYSGEKSIANSAGILGWSESLADWIRPGIMLYGVSPYREKYGAEFGLQAVMGLHSRLIAVKSVQAGDKVGYGGAWTCKKNTSLGVVAIGYGDGYPRQAESGTPVLVNDVRVPLVGRVSMDMITVDLQDLPDAKAGDPVTLWGEKLPVEEVARHANTIPYTLLCGITQRVAIVEQ